MFYIMNLLECDLEIIKKKNVISTAHIGGYSESALIDVAIKSLEIIKNEA